MLDDGSLISHYMNEHVMELLSKHERYNGLGSVPSSFPEGPPSLCPMP